MLPALVQLFDFLRVIGDLGSELLLDVSMSFMRTEWLRYGLTDSERISRKQDIRLRDDTTPCNFWPVDVAQAWAWLSAETFKLAPSDQTNIVL